MKRLTLTLMLLASGCSFIQSQGEEYRVDFYNNGTTQKIFINGVSGKEAILALEAFFASYELGPSSDAPPNIENAVISKQCSDQGLIYHVKAQGVQRSFLKECWESKCRLVYQPEPTHCIDIEN